MVASYIGIALSMILASLREELPVVSVVLVVVVLVVVVVVLVVE